jgi:hypothetical protein
LVANAIAILSVSTAVALDGAVGAVALIVMTTAFVVSFGFYGVALVRHRPTLQADDVGESIERRLLAGALLIAGVVIAAFGHFVVGVCMVAGAFLGYARATRRRSQANEGTRI